MPARICQRTSRRKAASSTVPSAVNGVTRAVKAPRSSGRVGARGRRVAFGGRGRRARHRRSAWPAGQAATASGERAARRRWGRRCGGRRSGAPGEPVGGGEDAGRVGGPVARGQAQLDGLAGGVEADEVHAGRRPGPDRDDLEVVGVRRDADGAATIRRAGRARCPDGRSRFAAPMPLDEVRVEGVDPPEERRRRLDETAEERDAEAEVGRGDGRRRRAARSRPRPAAGPRPSRSSR